MLTIRTSPRARATGKARFAEGTRLSALIVGMSIGSTSYAECWQASERGLHNPVDPAKNSVGVLAM